MNLVTLILAAGHGTRMKSTLPKVIHPACGRPLVYYPTKAALDVGSDRVVVVVNPETQAPVSSALSEHVGSEAFQTAIQEIPRGTGDAARSGLQGLQLSPEDGVLILSGDVPLLSADDLRPLIDALGSDCSLAFLTFRAEDPTGYGRILRNESGKVVEIREHKDLETDAHRAVTEVNAGVYAARAGELIAALSRLNSQNAQGELYLTDIVADIASRKPEAVRTIESNPEALSGVNDRAQLSLIEQILFARIRARWAQRGVSIVGAPLIDDTVELSSEVRVEDGVRLRGKTRVGTGTILDVGSVVDEVSIGSHVLIKPYCVLTDSRVGDGVQLGPFAHLRPGSVLEEGVHIGNFVETKNTLVKKGAKANHLTYLGDAEVGEKSNIGAGTIICNYDGFQKQKTVIGKGVFIGSDSQLIAPVTVGDNAYVATATTVNRDVPDGALAIGRSRQQNKEGYGLALRQRLSEAAAEARAKKGG